MQAAAGPAGRDRLIDGIRGLALGGVLVMNTLSFPHVFSSPAGVVEPLDSTLALAVQAACIALFQAKSYPLLMFLVGYGWAMLARRHGRSLPQAVVAGRRRQMLRQGVLGVLHGAFIYFGDILSWLAVLGIMLLAAPRRRLRRLRRTCLAWTAAWLLIGGVVWAGLLIGAPQPPVAPHWLTRATTWPEVFDLHQVAYASYFHQLPWQLPMMLALGTLGVVAGRLRLLEHRRTGARLWSFGTRHLLPAALLLNLGLAAWRIAIYPGGDVSAIDFATQFAGPLLAAGMVCALVRTWHDGGARWLAAFSPLGRMTMSFYVGHTLACTALFAGPAGALGPAFGTLGLFAFGMAYWAAACVLAPAWLSYAGRGPLEALVRGRGTTPARASRRNTIT
ncbi:MAG: DUF418 domain-containing protein [bacterium]